MGPFIGGSSIRGAHELYRVNERPFLREVLLEHARSDDGHSDQHGGVAPFGDRSQPEAPGDGHFQDGLFSPDDLFRGRDLHALAVDLQSEFRIF